MQKEVVSDDYKDPLVAIIGYHASLLMGDHTHCLS